MAITPSGDTNKRVDIDFLNGRLFKHQPTEPDHDLFQRGEVRDLLSPYPLERLPDFRFGHHASGQGAGERRKPQRFVLVDFHQLSPGAEKKHGPKLRIGARAQNHFVAFPPDHALDRHPIEMAGAFHGIDIFLDGVKRSPHTAAASLKIQKHPAHVGFVRDGLGMEFKTIGYPKASASRAASSAVVANRVSTMGIP
jgi:hypothetical protein